VSAGSLLARRSTALESAEQLRDASVGPMVHLNALSRIRSLPALAFALVTQFFLLGSSLVWGARNLSPGASLDRPFVRRGGRGARLCFQWFQSQLFDVAEQCGCAWMDALGDLFCDPKLGRWTKQNPLGRGRGRDADACRRPRSYPADVDAARRF